MSYFSLFHTSNSFFIPIRVQKIRDIRSRGSTSQLGSSDSLPGDGAGDGEGLEVGGEEEGGSQEIESGGSSSARKSSSSRQFYFLFCLVLFGICSEYFSILPFLFVSKVANPVAVTFVSRVALSKVVRLSTSLLLLLVLHLTLDRKAAVEVVFVLFFLVLCLLLTILIFRRPFRVCFDDVFFQKSR